MAEKYLASAREAGRQMRRDGRIAEETLKILNSCMMPRDDYISFTNGR